MTKFDKSKFSYHGGYLMYGDKFIARFKYAGPFTKAVFLKQLIKNHTVEEYLHKLLCGEAPLNILKDADRNWYDTTMAQWKNKIEQRYGIRPISGSYF